MDKLDQDRPLLEIRLDKEGSQPHASSDEMRKAIEETKREIQEAFGDRAQVEAATKVKSPA